MNLSVLRILDANANRAREALRVLEDYARFALNSDSLCSELKRLRHDFAAATAPFLQAAILTRDTPGDVGTQVKTDSEFHRPDVAAVLIAAGKRLSEALRTIEEYLKTDSPIQAAAVEAIRYHFYDLELRLTRTLPRSRFASVRLYVLITESICKRPWQQVAEAAVAGGADCLQLREKDLESGELLQRARFLVHLCRKHNILCIINDRPDIALLAEADGMHVGQTDLPATEARKLIGPDKILGVSTHNLDQARQAQLDGADYIGVGPVFRSATKTRDFLPGPDFARQAAQQSPLPTVAIAGITLENVDQVLNTGVQAIAITAAVAGCDDPRAAAETFKKKLSMPKARSGGVDILVCPSKSSPPANAIAISNPASPEPQFKSHSRRLPHWRLDGATYFVTFRVANGELNAVERSLILDHLREGDPKFYTLIAAVVMPDHVHILLKPTSGVDLERIMKGTKGASARKVHKIRGTTGNLWQDESWDRIMRDQAELDEKIEYCMINPVKRGLVTDPWDYPWWFYKPHRN